MTASATCFHISASPGLPAYLKRSERRSSTETAPLPYVTSIRAATTLTSSSAIALLLKPAQTLRDLQIGLAKFEKVPLSEIIARLIGELRAFGSAFFVIFSLIQVSTPWLTPT